jgi:carbamate kinase
VELRAIERLVAAGALVVCGGGGGIPVVEDAGALHGVEAVIDKDLTAALLAEELGAEKLIVLTDVPYVERDWGTPDATPIDAATPAELRELAFAAGSMGPKIEAACRFVERTDGEAVIGSLADLGAVSRGEAGTRILASAALAVR